MIFDVVVICRNVERMSSEEIKNLPFCYEAVMTVSLHLVHTLVHSHTHHPPTPHIQTKTITEFDEHMTAPMFGFSSADEYYKESRNSDKIHKICRPYICITSADDPFVPTECECSCSLYLRPFWYCEHYFGVVHAC